LPKSEEKKKKASQLKKKKKKKTKKAENKDKPGQQEETSVDDGILGDSQGTVYMSLRIFVSILHYHYHVFSFLHFFKFYNETLTLKSPVGTSQ